MIFAGKSPTIKEQLDANNGTAPGFDALRFILASCILIWHSVYVCYGPLSDLYHEAWNNPVLLPLLRGSLPAFFCLGGFLVTGSAYRVRSLFPFLAYRVLRIVPALFVEVTLSAIILGAVLTTLPLREYYTNPEFHSYFLNILGLVHYNLPGVFRESLVTTPPIVNINLWTLPPDFEGYAIMALLIATGIVFDRKFFGQFFILGSLFMLMLLPAMNWGDSKAVYIQPTLLIYSFYLGTAGYIFADRIRISSALVVIAFLSLMCFWYKYTILLGVIGICYLTLCFGFLKLQNIPFIKKGDYSYGIYLYGFPIERTLFHYFPETLHSWWQLALVAWPLTMIFSVLSWHFIEKPCLSLKRKIKKPAAVLQAEEISRS